MTVDLGEKVQSQVTEAYKLKQMITDFKSRQSEITEQIKEVATSEIPKGAKSVNVRGDGEIGAQVTRKTITPILKDVEAAREITGPTFNVFFDESATTTTVECKIKSGKAEALREALVAAGVNPDDYLECTIDTQVKVKKEWNTLATPPEGSILAPMDAMLGEEKANELRELVLSKPDQISLKFVAIGE